MAGKTKLTPKEILSLMPQKRPFCFVDEIVEVDEDKIIGKYTFRHDENFYTGHLPAHPITPGVILIESMGQVGLVALSIYLSALDFSVEHASHMTTMFTEVESEFFNPVMPGDTVIIRAEKIWWKRMKLRSKVEMTFEDGTIVARATIAGMGVKND